MVRLSSKSRIEIWSGRYINNESYCRQPDDMDMEILQLEPIRNLDDSSQDEDTLFAVEIINKEDLCDTYLTKLHKRLRAWFQYHSYKRS